MSYGGKVAKKNKNKDTTSNFMLGRYQMLDDSEQDAKTNLSLPKKRKSKNTFETMVKPTEFTTGNLSRTQTAKTRFSKTQKNL